MNSPFIHWDRPDYDRHAFAGLISSISDADLIRLKSALELGVNVDLIALATQLSRRAFNRQRQAVPRLPADLEAIADPSANGGRLFEIAAQDAAKPLAAMHRQFHDECRQVQTFVNDGLDPQDAWSRVRRDAQFARIRALYSSPAKRERIKSRR